jgi:hypothetical protein
LELSFVCCWNSNTSESRSEIVERFCGVGEGRRRSVGPTMWEMRKCYLESTGERNMLHTVKQTKKKRLDWSHLAQKLSCKTHYWRKCIRGYRSDREKRNKT